MKLSPYIVREIKRAKLTPRDKKRLTALRWADEALYCLWRHSVLNSPEMHAINALQLDYIQPAIRELLHRKKETL